MGRFKSKMDTLRQTYRLCALGGMPKPKWLIPFMLLNRVEELQIGQKKLERRKKMKRLEFPEDRLIQSYYDRYPQAKLQPIDLSSFEPPPIKKMAILQQVLIEKGVSKHKAKELIETEMMSKGELKKPQRPSVLAQVQEEEERVLMAAIQRRKLEQGS